MSEYMELSIVDNHRFIFNGTTLDSGWTTLTPVFLNKSISAFSHGSYGFYGSYGSYGSYSLGSYGTLKYCLCSKLEIYRLTNWIIESIMV